MAPTPGFAKGVKVLQTGGHNLKPATLKGLNLTKKQGKTAIESMKMLMVYEMISMVKS